MTDLQDRPGVIVFGEALVDAFPSGPVLGGAPFNVARALGKFGCAPLMVTRVGDDRYGTLVEADMQLFGIDGSGLQKDRLHGTGVVNVHIGTGADVGVHRFEILDNQAYDYIDGSLAASAARRYLALHGKRGTLYFGTLAQRRSTSRDALHQLISDTSLIKFLDLNLRDGQATTETIQTSLHVADIIKLNDGELRSVCQLAGQSALPATTDAQDMPAWLDAMHKLTNHFGLTEMVVTLGAHGYLYQHLDGTQVNGWQQPIAGSVVDTVGCGDAFSAVFMTGMTCGWPLTVTLQRANEFAASVCSIRGAVSADPTFYQNWKTRWQLN